MAAIALALLPAPAHADAARSAPSTRELWSYGESGCTEIAYPRGGLASEVRKLVASRFDLEDWPVSEGQPTRVRLFVNEVTCERGRFPGYGSERGPYSFVLVSASVTANSGDQRDGVYVLFFATESRHQRSALSRLGWPIAQLSGRSTSLVTRDTSGNTLAMSLRVVGGGWDHTVAAMNSVTPSTAGPSQVEYYRDTNRGRQTLCFTNRTVYSGATIVGDLRTTPFADVAWVPPLLYPAGGDLVVGGWNVTVASGPCPTLSSAPSGVPRVGS